MKKFVSIIALATLAFSPAIAKTFNIDPAHSSVGFQVKHMTLSNVSGQFDSFKGVVDIDPKTKKINKLQGEVSIKSVDTKNSKRDDHLRSNDFFDLDKFSTATLVMTKQEGNKFYGDLTIRGIKKPVVWNVEVNGPVTNPMSNKQVMSIEINGKVNRKDFQVGTDTSNLIVSDEIKVNIQLEVTE